MSRIVEKAFDASKKIVRSIFRGSPNLITTSDLNRQIEALKYQVDRLDEKTGFIIEGATFTFKLVGSTLSVELLYDSMEYKGCTFTPIQRVLTTSITGSAPYAYLCLVADKETITYDTDSTHEIAGAKFADGTSMRAADQVVYRKEKLVLTHFAGLMDNLVGIVAFLSLRNGKVYAIENWTDKYSPLRVKDDSGSVGSGLETSQKYPIKLDDTYDVAFGKIQGFLGDSKVYKGGWGYFHQSYDEITEQAYNDILVNSPAELTKVGPIYYVRLLGLNMNESINTENVLNNLRWLIMSLSMDARGIIMFRNLPGTYNIGRFMGATIGISPLMEIKNVESGVIKAQQYVDSLTINSSYVGEIEQSPLINAFGFSLSSSGNYDGDKFSFVDSVISAGGGGIALTLMFADKNIW